jgi:WD40 repeat protein
LAGGMRSKKLVGHREVVWAIAVTADGRAVSASFDHTLRVWDLSSGACTATLEGHRRSVNAVAVTADGRAVSVSDDRTLKVWDLASGACTVTLEGHGDDVNAVALMAGGLAVSGSADRTVRVWDLARLTCVAHFRADAAITAIACAPDGLIIAGDAGGALHALEFLQEGECQTWQASTRYSARDIRTVDLQV